MQNVTTDGWNWTSGWSELGVIPLVHWFGTYQIGDGNTITVEPNGDGARNALKLTLADASKSVAKANFGVEFASTTDLAVYHTSHRMRLNEAFQYMADNLPDAVGPKGTVLGWMTIMEIWNSRDPNMTGDPGGSARWTLALKKAAGAPSPWTWELRGEYMQPDALLYSALFSSDNTTTPVPIDSWFTLDLYLARGDGQSGRPDGRMVLTLTPDGGSPVVVFDVTGPTMYPGRPDLFVRDVEPLKVYTNPPVLSWVLNSGRQLEIQYNDFKWFKN